MAKIITGKPELIKKMNRNIVFKLIIKYGQVSRSSLSKETGLALPSIMRIVDGLIEDKLIIEVGKGISTGGRKPQLLKLNEQAMYFIGIEIGLTVGIVLADLGGEVIERRIIDDIDGNDPYMILDKTKFGIEEIMDDHKLLVNKIVGIGIGTPGNGFKYEHEVDHAVAKGWQNIDIKAWFEEYFDYKIIIDNIVRTRTLGEIWFGQGRLYKDFLYVLADRGVGCGIVQGGVIRKGSDGVAGEFGHTVISVDGRLCYCGNVGCIEMYISTGSIINDVNEKSQNSFNDYTEVTKYLEKNHGFLEKINKYIGVGIGNLINIHNPKVVILGGAVFTQTPGIDRGTRQAIKKNIFNTKAMETKIIFSECTEDQEILGCVALIIEEEFKSVEIH